MIPGNGVYILSAYRDAERRRLNMNKDTRSEILERNFCRYLGLGGWSRVTLYGPIVCLITLIIFVMATKDSWQSEVESDYWKEFERNIERKVSALTKKNGSEMGDKGYSTGDESDAMLSFGSSIDCEVSCETGKPCEYETETDLRVIVLAYDDAELLRKNLDSLRTVDTDGDAMIVDIWIDRSPNGTWSEHVLRLATHLVKTWERGMVCIHLQEYHAGTRSQWINAWRPRKNTTEIALIMEEDVLVSDYVYLWLRKVWDIYMTEDAYRLSGASPVDENLRYDTKKGTKRIQGPAQESVYAYQALSGGVFAPRAYQWRAFQEWYQDTKVLDPGTKIFIPGYLPENWYQENWSRTMPWEMWYIYYCSAKKLFALYPNLGVYTGLPDMALVYHAGQAGMTGIARESDGTPVLMKAWSKLYATFLERLTYLNYAGYTMGIV